MSSDGVYFYFIKVLRMKKKTQGIAFFKLTNIY